MMRGMFRIAGLAVLYAFFTSTGLAGQEPPDDADGEAKAGRTTLEGVYSEAQARRGEELMWNVCAECHVDADFGTAFLQSWEGATVGALLDELKATMPEDSPGRLRDQEYLDVIGYILRINGLPTGETEIGEADVETITIEWEP